MPAKVTLATPEWIRISPEFSLSTPSAKYYTEYFLTVYNDNTNSRLTSSHPTMEKKLKDFISQQALYRPAWFEQAFGYALAKGKDKDRNTAYIDCILFKEYCKKLIWEHCLANGYNEIVRSESEFKKYSGL